MSKIRSLSDEIAENFHPEKIILFGSHSRGKPGVHSDVDLLVVLPFEGKSVWKSIEIIKKVNPDFSVDLIVRTPKQILRRLKWNDFFMREIMETGKVLYEADNS